MSPLRGSGGPPRAARPLSSLRRAGDGRRGRAGRGAPLGVPPPDPGAPTGPGAAAERRRTLCRAAAARPLPSRCLAEGDGAWRRSPWQWDAWAEWSGPQRGGERAREGGSARPRPSPAPRCLRRAAAAERPPARPGRGARTHRAEGRAPRCPRRAPWAARRAAERARRRRRRCAAAMAVAVETRPELVGKRFLCVGGGEEPAESGRWRAGVIRAVSQRDSHSPDLAVSGAAGPRRGAAAAAAGGGRAGPGVTQPRGERAGGAGSRGALGGRGRARGAPRRARPGRRGRGGEEGRGNVIVSAPFMSAVTARSEERLRARGPGRGGGHRRLSRGRPRNARSARRSRAPPCRAGCGARGRLVPRFCVARRFWKRGCTRRGEVRRPSAGCGRDRGAACGGRRGAAVGARPSGEWPRGFRAAAAPCAGQGSLGLRFHTARALGFVWNAECAQHLKRCRVPGLYCGLFVVSSRSRCNSRCPWPDAPCSLLWFCERGPRHFVCRACSGVVRTGRAPHGPCTIMEELHSGQGGICWHL